jgi:ribosomal protein L11 methylase PrmA
MSRLNFRNNRIRGVVLLKGLAGVHRKFDVLVANITAPALLEMHDALVRRLKRGGILILSGLIYRDVLSLLRGYRDLKFQGRKNRLGWAVLVFKKS